MQRRSQASRPERQRQHWPTSRTRLRQNTNEDSKMPASRLIALLLIFALAISGCAGSGRAVKTECPKLPPAPASLMQPPQTEMKVRAELFEPPQPATRK